MCRHLNDEVDKKDLRVCDSLSGIGRKTAVFDPIMIKEDWDFPPPRICLAYRMHGKQVDKKGYINTLLTVKTSNGSQHLVEGNRHNRINHNFMNLLVLY